MHVSWSQGCQVLLALALGMGKDLMVHTEGENQCQVPMSEKLLQISTHVIPTHVHCMTLGPSLVRAVFFWVSTLK